MMKQQVEQGFVPKPGDGLGVQDVPIKLKLEVERCGGDKLGYSLE